MRTIMAIIALISMLLFLTCCTKPEKEAIDDDIPVETPQPDHIVPPDIDVNSIKIYVDQTLPSDITDHSYSVENRDNSGADGCAYTSIQKALNALENFCGDDPVVDTAITIYMRGGTYAEHLNFRIIKDYQSPRGTADNWITLSSYPGEWAKIDPAYSEYAAVFDYQDSYTSGPHFWRFQRFEVTGGGGLQNGAGSGGGIMFDTGTNLIFEFLYIHDNHGSGSTNDGGIVLKASDAKGANNVTIRYCYLKNNGDPNHINCGNVVLFSNYVYDPVSIIIEETCHHIDIRYNYIADAHYGIKNKAVQWLLTDHTGNDISNASFADSYHHNIFENSDFPVSSRKDFTNIFNNIFLNTTSGYSGVDIGEPYSSARNPFFNCVYNNVFIKTRLTINHCIDEQVYRSYEPPFHPYFYAYNNIFDVQQEESDGHNDFNVLFTWSAFSHNDIDMSTMIFENNLFYNRAEDSRNINIGEADNDISPSDYLAQGYAATLYTSEKAGLYSDNDYNINYDFSTGEGKNISNSGFFGDHPYYSGLNIPAYVGAANTNTCAWISGVRNLRELSVLASGDGTPEWVEK